MSPFALFLRQARVNRQMAQNSLAFELGYEPSYLSALERGEKGPPKREFVERLIRILHLDAEEQAQLELALQSSRRQILIPRGASCAEFRLLHQVTNQIGKLRPAQIHLIRLALAIPPAALDGMAPIETLYEKEGAQM